MQSRACVLFRDRVTFCGSSCWVSLALLSSWALSQPAQASSFVYTTINVPGAFATLPFDVNNLGQIVGATTLSPNTLPEYLSQSFVFSSGQYSVFTYPGTNYSEAHAINNLGIIVGEFRDETRPLSENIFHGYLASARGIVQFDVPGARRTFGNGINDAGEIVGGYNDVLGNGFGFIDKGGHFTTISFGDGSFTEAHAVNNQGDIAGAFHGSGRIFGFLDRNNQITTLDVPGSNYTVATGLNDLGDVVGDYFLPDGKRHGFLYDGTTYTEVAVPGYADTTFARGINDEGEIVGGFQVGSTTNGFVALNPVPVPHPTGLVALILLGAGLAALRLVR
jgi:uncharacterized membrane protein